MWHLVTLIEISNVEKKKGRQILLSSKCVSLVSAASGQVDLTGETDLVKNKEKREVNKNSSDGVKKNNLCISDFDYCITALVSSLNKWAWECAAWIRSVSSENSLPHHMQIESVQRMVGGLKSCGFTVLFLSCGFQPAFPAPMRRIRITLDDTNQQSRRDIIKTN